MRRSPTCGCPPRQWDALQIPVSVAFFFVNSTLDRVSAFYPSPAGATESLLPLDTWDELTAAHAELATLEPDVEAFLVRVSTGRRTEGECYLVPIDACYELVGQLRTLWRGFDGGQEAHDAHRRVLRRCAGEGAMSDLGFEVLDARAERIRRGADDHVPPAHHRAAAARRCMRSRLRCQIRIEPHRAATTRDEEVRLVELFGEPRQWGDSLKPVPVDARRHDDHRVRRARPRSTCRSRARTTSRSRAPSTSTRSTTARSRSCCCSPARRSSRGDAGLSVAPVAWHEEASYRLPVRVWRDMMDLYFPNSGWLRVGRETLDALSRFKAARALPTWDHVVEQLLKEAGEEGT